MKSTTKKLKAGILALVCVLGFAAAATAQAGFSIGYYGGNDGRYAISLGYSDGGYYAPRYYAPRYYQPRYYAPRYYAPQSYAPVQGQYYGDANAGPCRVDEITSYYGDGRVTCTPDPASYGANSGYYNGGYYGANNGYYDGGYYRGGAYYRGAGYYRDARYYRNGRYYRRGRY